MSTRVDITPQLLRSKHSSSYGDKVLMNIAEEYDGRDAYIDRFDFYSPTAA